MTKLFDPIYRGGPDYPKRPKEAEMFAIRNTVKRLQSACDHLVAAREDLADLPEGEATVSKLDDLIDDLNEQITVLGG